MIWESSTNKAGLLDIDTGIGRLRYCSTKL